MSTLNYKRTKFACYSAYFTMSSIFSLPPLLFVTFNEKYGISWTLLGTLVLINFCTQMSIDLVFTFFSKHFNVRKIVRIMPLITSLGLFVYALVPTFFPDMAYLGLVIGTVIFSVSAGLSEVLLSPTIAALPSDNPQRDMSVLHSLYGVGVFTMILISTLFLKLFGTGNWMYLTMFLACLPVISAILFMCSPMPEMNESHGENEGTKGTKRRTVSLALCLGCIFFGSCAENAMTNWVSGYMESALGVDKALGDILGMAMFAVLLVIARLLYAKYGKNIMRVLLLGMIGAAVCYIAAGLVSNVFIAFGACILTGFSTSMLWPGTLIMMEEKVPNAGVAAFALMAAGGDLGASVSPQLMGVVIDGVSTSSFAQRFPNPEEIGMRAGMLVTAIFPIIGIFVVALTMRYFRKGKENDN